MCHANCPKRFYRIHVICRRLKKIEDRNQCESKQNHTHLEKWHPIRDEVKESENQRDERQDERATKIHTHFGRSKFESSESKNKTKICTNVQINNLSVCAELYASLLCCWVVFLYFFFLSISLFFSGVVNYDDAIVAFSSSSAAGQMSRRTWNNAVSKRTNETGERANERTKPLTKASTADRRRKYI